MIVAPLPPDETERLAALLRAAVLDTPAEPDFDDLTRIAAQICDMPIALISLIDDRRQWFKARVGLETRELPREVAFCAHAILQREIFVVHDALGDERFADSPMVQGELRVRFYAGAPLLTAEGRAVGTLCVLDRVPRTLTEDQMDALRALGRQVSAQLALRQKASDLRESEARVRAIMNTAADGIIAVDSCDTIQAFNPAAERIFGCDAAAVTGRPLQVLIPEVRHGELGGCLHRYLPGGVDDHEVIGRRHDGSTFPMEISVGEVQIRGQRSFTAVVRDVTERRQMEQMKNEFVSTVSHELRTPLTAIRGALGLLEGGMAGELPSEAVELVAVARANSERLIRLINDILDLEKMEAGKLELSTEELDPAALLRTTLDGIQGVAAQTGVRLASQIVSQGPLSGDPHRLIQVLTNLVSNAIKFSSPGGEVLARAERQGDSLRFSVIDQGPGIAPDQIAKLFGKFKQLDASDSRQKGGTGLGLAISKAIIEQHGGTIGVESTPGQGSTFWFELPLRHGRQVPPVPPAVPQTILLAEEEGELAQLLTGMLSADGYLVERVTSLEQAELALARAAPAAIITGVHLLDGDALGFIERLRQRAAIGEVPVVFLAGGAGEPVSFSSPLLIDWLSEPFDEVLLHKAIHRALRRPGTARVLLVEDDPSARLILGARLRHMGVVCIEVGDGAEAIRLARSLLPDLIILDVLMPGMNGFDVVEVLRGETSRATPLLVYSGLDLGADERYKLTLGVTRYLTKARVSEQEFVGTVRDLLNGLLGP